jgi:hypothetical protein
MTAPAKRFNPTKPVPLGVVKVVIRLLELARGDCAVAAAIARKWYATDGDSRWPQIADLLEER